MQPANKIKLLNTFLIINLFISFTENVYSNKNKVNSLELNTIYGKDIITEEVLIELINDPYVQRLKRVNQYGIQYYTMGRQNYTRYEHSIGVLYLTRKYGASLKEQIAALLHDVSHTAFSHLGDFLYNKAGNKDSHQDDIHYDFIKNSSLKNILEKYKYSIEDIIHKNNKFYCLEADLPDICTDRLEYNLYGGYIDGLITLEDIKNILEHLKFENTYWYFTDKYWAKKFAEVTIDLSINRWASYKNSVENLLFADTIKKALKTNLIKMEDISVGYDNIIWEKLISSDNKDIKISIKKVLNCNNYYKIDKENYDIYLKPKSRIVNPLVNINNVLFRLNIIDNKFNQKMKAANKVISEGLYIKFIN